jgi:hypothetical protein
MKRTKPSKREIARQLIAKHNREQEAIRIRKQIEEARAKEAARPRIGPREPAKILPCKEDTIKLEPQKPIMMKTLDGRTCSIADKTFPGMAGEPVTVPEITFENGDEPKLLNRETLRMFGVGDRITLEDYLADVQKMNEEYALYWVQ